MEQYISKSALVAEIEKWISGWTERLSTNPSNPSFFEGGIEVGKYILSFIDTLEVKEVDLEHLEQEVKDFCYEYDDRKEKWYELCPNDRKLLYNPTWANFAMSIAKHFFELGMSVSNKEQKGK